MNKNKKIKKGKQKEISIDISNKSLAAIITIAMVISLFTMITVSNEKDVYIYNSGITGLVGTNQTIGNVTATIQSYTYINFTNLSINWGSGFVGAGAKYCNLTIDYDGSKETIGDIGSDSCVGWTTTDGALAIENLGNEDVTLNLSFDNTALSLFGAGTYNALQYRVFDGETGSCLNNTGVINPDDVYTAPGGTNLSDWQSPFAADQSNLVCAWFNSSSTSNQINIGIKYGIDASVSAATKTLTITAYGRTCDGSQGTRTNCTAAYDPY